MENSFPQVRGHFWTMPQKMDDAKKSTVFPGHRLFLDDGRYFQKVAYTKKTLLLKLLIYIPPKKQIYIKVFQKRRIIVHIVQNWGLTWGNVLDDGYYSQLSIVHFPRSGADDAFRVSSGTKIVTIKRPPGWRLAVFSPSVFHIDGATECEGGAVGRVRPCDGV